MTSESWGPGKEPFILEGAQQVKLEKIGNRLKLNFEETLRRAIDEFIENHPIPAEPEPITATKTVPNVAPPRSRKVESSIE